MAGLWPTGIGRSKSQAIMTAFGSIPRDLKILHRYWDYFKTRGSHVVWSEVRDLEVRNAAYYGIYVPTLEYFSTGDGRRIWFLQNTNQHERSLYVRGVVRRTSVRFSSEVVEHINRNLYIKIKIAVKHAMKGQRQSRCIVQTRR